MPSIICCGISRDYASFPNERCRWFFDLHCYGVNAEIIAVGSEMLTPYRMDTNSLYLTDQLNQLGVDLIFKSVVGDNLRRLVGAAQHALFRSDIVIFSGGLGPTEDDLTREAVAEALGVGLRRDEEILSRLEQRFAERGASFGPRQPAAAFCLAAPRASRICRSMHSGCGRGGIERKIRNPPGTRHAQQAAASPKRQQAAAVQRLAPRSGRLAHRRTHF